MSKQPTVAFDVDGTLIDLLHDCPRYAVIDLFRCLEALGCEMYIWSGGGVDYATRWAEKLGLKAKVVGKGSFEPDIAIDDFAHTSDFNLGKISIGV